MNEIFTRVSIRKYEDRPVEEEKIERLLRAAMAAPSTANQQPWEFYVVTDRAKIEELSKVTPFTGAAAGAPVVFVPCYRTTRVKDVEWGLLDLSAATENLLLEAVAQGLGACWMGIAPNKDRIADCDAILGITEADEIHSFCIIPVGYPAEERPQIDRYEEDRVHRL